MNSKNIGHCVEFEDLKGFLFCSKADDIQGPRHESASKKLKLFS